VGQLGGEYSSRLSCWSSFCLDGSQMIIPGERMLA
jgi:hypothetical protein